MKAKNNAMRILMVNKFLYPKGGSETYCFKLSEYLRRQGHEVQFFGMADARNIEGNSLGLAVSGTDFKHLSLKKVFYPFRIIYSIEAEHKIARVLEAFKPHIVHLNNINYQLTPSILYAIQRTRTPVVMTLHDYQLICPNHMLYNERSGACEMCCQGRFFSCIRGRCIHGSLIKSLMGAMEGWLYKKLGTYHGLVDAFIAPSRFMGEKFTACGFDNAKITVIHNFTEPEPLKYPVPKKDYVLYFGALTAQKGITQLFEAILRLPAIKFVIAGYGEIPDTMKAISNVKWVGYKEGQALRRLIREALFTVCPSVWYENCPFSILESQACATPVIGADIGGIPELVEDGADGLLVESGNATELAEKINFLYHNREVLQSFSQRCAQKAGAYAIESYYQKLMQLYTHVLKEKGVAR